MSVRCESCINERDISEETFHHMHGAEPAVLSIYCAVFTVFLFCLFVHCTFIGSCAVVNVR